MSNSISVSGNSFTLIDKTPHALEFLVDAGYVECEDCDNPATEIITSEGPSVLCLCAACLKERQEKSAHESI